MRSVYPPGGSLSCLGEVSVAVRCSTRRTATDADLARFGHRLVREFTFISLRPCTISLETPTDLLVL